jgi:hypothetical protein
MLNQSSLGSKVHPNVRIDMDFTISKGALYKQKRLNFKRNADMAEFMDVRDSST